MNIIIIPVRLSSSRFPNKPFVNIEGKTMIEHTWIRSTMSKLADRVIIATPNIEIKKIMHRKGADIVMTSHYHTMCMGRINEAVKKEKLYKSNIVVVQGDEPLVNPKTIDKMFKILNKKNDFDMLTVMSNISDKNEILNPNRMKIIYDNKYFVNYISREPIPSPKKFKGKFNYKKLICLYGLSGNFLKKYTSLGMSRYEKVESIDILRVIENNYKLKVIETKDELFNIDTPSDVPIVRKAMKKDTLSKKYL